VAVLAFGATALGAQGVAGKVQGTVLDPTGQPVANAQVFVLGTAFAALTNEQGFYFFNNVPAGTYDMRAQFIGYQPAEVRGIRVLADQTLTVNFGLSGAVALEAITITAAETPIVPRDQVSSRSVVVGDVIDKLPVDDGRDVLNLQPGVVESGDALGVSIRGGRPGEAVVYIDGVPVRRLRTGATQINLGTNALEEASVTTGAMGTEFGDAQSGVISLVTRSGGPRFQGNLVYETDEIFGNTLSSGFNRFEGSLSGPIFGNLTFFVSGVVQGEVSNRRGKGWDAIPTYTLGGLDTTVVSVTEAGDSVALDIPRFVQFTGQCDAADNFGFECQGRRRPYDFQTNWRANAKLTYTYGSGSRVAVSGLWDQDQNRTSPTTQFGGQTFNPQAYSGTRTNSQVYILNWVQQVFRTAETELAFDLNMSWQTDRQRAGVLDREWEMEHRSPALGVDLSPMKFLVDFDNFSGDDPSVARNLTKLETQDEWNQYIRNVYDNLGTRLPYLGRNDLRSTQSYRANPYAISTGWRTGGIDDIGYRLDYDRRAIGRLNVDWQFDRYNRLKFGGEYMFGRVNVTTSNYIRQIFQDVYSEGPRRWAAYIQDRLDLGDVVLELGLRYDNWSTRGVFPLTPARIFTHPAYSPDSSIESMTCSGAACEADSAIFDFVFKEAVAHTAWSPRLRVSFPVTDRTNFRLSYAHQVQSPDGESTFEGKNNDLSITNTNDAFGGDVRHGKSITFEFGIRHAFTRDLVLDFAAFNKDKVADLTYRILDFFDPVVGRIQPVNVLTNADFGNVKGFDVSLLQRVGNWFNGQIGYTFQTAKGTGSNPLSYLNTQSRQISQVTGERTPPPQAILRTDDDRTHNIVGALAFNWPDDFQQGTWYGQILRNAGLFARFRFVSGLPYTRLTNVGNGQTSFGGTGFGLVAEREDDQLNASELPWQYNFDLRVTKGLRLGPTDWTLYADFRNLLNVRNVIGIFAETGDVVNERFFENTISSELVRLRQDAGGARVITTADGLEAIDLSDCAGWQGAGQEADCVLLQRAEARFGNGDLEYDEDEQLAALTSWYNINNGEQTFLGDPLHIRLGVELAF
jgi:hypothetical protein